MVAWCRQESESVVFGMFAVAVLAWPVRGALA
jgi:hypothetical protein